MRFCGIWALAAVFIVPVEAAAWNAKETARGTLVRWNRPSVPMRMAEDVRAIGGEEAFLSASALWSGDSAAPTLFVEEGEAGSQGVDEQPGIYIPVQWSFSDRVAVTQTTFSADGYIVDSDILLNPAHFGPDGDGEYDLARVLAHELGHVLGLEESEAPGAMMWPQIPREGLPDALPEDDIEGAIALYGSGPNLALCSTGKFNRWLAAWFPVMMAMIWLVRPRA